LRENASLEWSQLKGAGGRQRDPKLAEVFIKELKAVANAMRPLSPASSKR